MGKVLYVFNACHPLTGALIDPDDALATEAYTPSERLRRLIRARDGRCRFPGCTVPARSCDIDHVQAWPRGPTSVANLMCLCRRHHRVKQRRRWRVIIGDDATVTWTDPAGAVHVTDPVDHLGAHEARSTRLGDPGCSEGDEVGLDAAEELDESDDVNASDEPDDVVDVHDLVGGDPPPTNAVPELRPWLISPIEAVAGVRAEHSVAAVAREIRDLRRHRRPGSRCGYVDVHPYVQGSRVAVELADDYVGQHGDSGGASPSHTSEAAPAADPPPPF